MKRATNPTAASLGLFTQAVKTDEELAQSAQMGNTAAAGVLYDRYAKVLFRYFYHLCRHHEEAEDLASQLFCQIFERIGQFDPSRAAFKTWLFGAARNLWVDTVRRFGRKPILLDELPENPAKEENPTQALEDQERLAQVSELVKKLPEETRLALFLHIEMNMEYKDIADILGRSAAATKMLVWRAVGRIKKDLGLPS